MTPIAHFQSVWLRCDELKALHVFLETRLTSVLSANELLRAEWVARVSALDLYIHELVIQKMVEIFSGNRVPSPAFLRFQISGEVLLRTSRGDPSQRISAFELEVRNRLGFVSYQDPEKIADGIRLISEVELWNAVAINSGATESQKSVTAKALKLQLSTIVDRRNKIAHEGDLKPGAPRIPWDIERKDVDQVTNFIEHLVNTIDAVVM